ncbi:hypothetical protein SY83_10505 [Paenibacillus swuensis]|uniref:Uncharacterized protein n=1 Tax=Paenibacillus swuensis TaxID=1178515 RepID=A0A172THU3_9BACL|nr:hypothetical protein [Paenibacillus swuensis]ANE46629.1 hypothetical protein SY83_10505 [Paenibacillus swuensis]
MDFIWFYIFSMLEQFAVFALMLTFFRFDLKPYVKEVLLIGSILSYLSYIHRTDPALAPYDVLVQTIVLLMFLWIVLKIHLFYGFLMICIGVGSLICMQTMGLFIYRHLDIALRPEDFNSAAARILQLLSSAALVLISYFIKRRRWGVTYINHASKINFNWTGLHLKLLLLFIALTVSAGFSYFYWIQWGITPSLFIFSTLLLSLSGIAFLAVRKEMDLIVRNLAAKKDSS